MKKKSRTLKTEGIIPKDTEKIRLYTHIHKRLKGWTIYTLAAD